MQTLSRPTLRALALLSLLMSPTAFAEERDELSQASENDSVFPRWIALSVRGGYLMPGGMMEDDAVSPVYLYEVYKGLFAAILEPTFRIGSHVEVGPWLQVSYAQMRVQCSRDEVCPGRNRRFGLQANVHWNAQGPYSPWLGLAVGHDRSSFSLPDVEATYSGLDFTFQAGFDKNLAGPFWAGLFISGTGGQYDTLKVDSGTESAQGGVRGRAIHLWIGFGFRLRLAAPIPAHQS
ncbi:hypothetical protein LZ198_16855 [Myxococcus sp. K15C18031901]|uniref:hypothetical protein n=1 Tax=Myxococcus dinghuensis TaxID=2906761 RepID=UPI0020A76EF3|nr:hypothetical protein [Myxococcus dinghuensis]MCP3100541.1 hypothetical protein [Myxococcus dinghuensis]